MLKSSVEVMFASEWRNFSLRCCLFVSLNSLDAIQMYRLAAEIWQRRLPSNNFFILSGTENNTLVVIICRGHTHRFGISARPVLLLQRGCSSSAPLRSRKEGTLPQTLCFRGPQLSQIPELNLYNTGVPSVTRIWCSDWHSVGPMTPNIYSHKSHSSSPRATLSRISCISSSR